MKLILSLIPLSALAIVRMPQRALVRLPLSETNRVNVSISADFPDEDTVQTLTETVHILYFSRLGSRIYRFI